MGSTTRTSTTTTSTALREVTTISHTSRAGVVVRSVAVADISDDHAGTEDWSQRLETCEDHLREQPGAGGPTVEQGRLELHNDVSRWLYGSSAALTEWRRDLVPSARALYPMQRPYEASLPSGAPLDPMAVDAFICSSDGIGIRTRAAVMRDVVTRQEEWAPRADGGRPTWVSLACGAAVPVLDAAAAVGSTPRLHLVDLDESALAFARELAAGQGFVEGVDVTVSRRDLVRTLVARDTLVDEIGAGTAAVVDALGIFEYFGAVACVRLLRNAFALVEPGGVLVVANMLSDRPQMAVNQRGVGWPAVRPRSVDELVDLVAAAGLPLDGTTVHLPQDGVYAVVEVVRPLDLDVIDLRGS